MGLSLVKFLDTFLNVGKQHLIGIGKFIHQLANIIIIFQYLSFERFCLGIWCIFLVPCNFKAFDFFTHCHINSFLNFTEPCF